MECGSNKHLHYCLAIRYLKGGDLLRTLQVHTSVSTTAGQFATSKWIDTNRYNAIGITYSLSSAVPNLALIQWSNDGVAIHGEEGATIFPQTSDRFRTTEMRTKARYVRVLVKNADTSSRTINAWVYLKN